MPRWGRPPGAQLGRHIRRREPWREVELQAEEINGEDGYVLGGRWREYNDYMDETEGNGVDYDLYDDSDSTVAYAVQLALKNREEALVENALERIRRAQAQGHNNIRLSTRELDALERKRTQTSSLNGSRGKTGVGVQLSPPDERRTRALEHITTNVSAPRTRSQRSGSAASDKPSSPYLADSAWIQSPQRPRTPTHQGPRPQHSSPSLRPPRPQQYAPERFYSVPAISPQSSPRKQPLIHSITDGQWTPPYPIQSPLAPPFLVDQPPYPTGTVPYTGYRSSVDERHSNAPHSLSPRRAPTGSAKRDSSEEHKDGSHSDEIQIVDVVQRKVPIGSPTRSVGKAGLQRANRR